MGIFSRNTGGEKLILVFDIGSSHVGGALFMTDQSGVPKILKVVREPITLQKTLDVERFLASTVKSLDIVASKIYKSGLGLPKEIFCVLSSPWHISETRVIRLEKNTPFIFTSKMADALIQKEIALFEEAYLAKYSDALSPVKSIEFKNIRTMLNGYETPSPLNQAARELEMTIFFSISPEQILKQTEETVRKYFFFKSIRFSSFTLASFVTIRDIFSNNEDFLLIDIDGEVTDICMTKKNLLRESISFPLGHNFLTRKAATLLKTPTAEAKSLVTLYQNGHAGDDVAKKIEQVMNKLKAEWLVKFQESLANLSNDISIPSTIYLSVDKDEASFFRKTIEDEQFNQYTLTQSKFKIITLDLETFHGMVAFKSDTVRDPRLIIDSIYINRFLYKI